MFGDESAGGQVEDQAAIHLLVEIEIEMVEGLLRVAKPSLFVPPLQQSLAATVEFIGDQAGDQIDGRHGLGLGLT